MGSKDPPSDSTPGSWNTPLNPLTAIKTTTMPAGLSIAAQDMGSMPQLRPDAATVAGSGSSQHVMTRPGRVFGFQGLEFRFQGEGVIPGTTTPSSCKIAEGLGHCIDKGPPCYEVLVVR